MKYSARKSLKCLVFPEAVPRASCIGRPNIGVFGAIISALEALGHRLGRQPRIGCMTGKGTGALGQCRRPLPRGCIHVCSGGSRQLPPAVPLPQTVQLLGPPCCPQGRVGRWGPLPPPVSGSPCERCPCARRLKHTMTVRELLRSRGRSRLLLTGSATPSWQSKAVQPESIKGRTRTHICGISTATCPPRNKLEDARTGLNDGDARGLPSDGPETAAVGEGVGKPALVR